MTERWLPIVGYEGYYEVSSWGCIRRTAPSTNSKPGQILRLQTAKSGCQSICLSMKNQTSTLVVSQIVANAFLGLCPPGLTLRHRDGNLGNNHLGNLEYGPYSDSLPGEIWKPAVEFEGLYEVSNRGRVRRIKAGYGTRVGRILTWVTHSEGYSCVNLHKDGKHYFKRVHVLVAKSFLGPYPAGHEVNHVDAIRSNPDLSNLEYLTPTENNHYYWSRPWARRGSRHWHAKVTEQDVQTMRRLYPRVSASRLARRYGLCAASVLDIVRGITWKHVPMTRED